MSLWYKQIDAITYGDVDQFCAAKIPEGLRLDYKREMPKDLAKIVAAFANTLGGLIVLGVDADKTTNMPIWPTTTGMEKEAGLERITAICRDNIYPPVRPQISPIIDNPHVAGAALAVLRVNESPEAPHAVKGLVYERTGSQGTPYQHSHIDRIGHLLGRHNQIEEQRLVLVSDELKRATRQLAEVSLELGDTVGLMTPCTAAGPPRPRGLPLRWASVIPVYPWRDLCTPHTCHDLMTLFLARGSSFNSQKVPGGAFARRRIPVGFSKSAEAACCSLSTRGMSLPSNARPICFSTGTPPSREG